jgi:RNA polymerase sigma-70 factor (ECF subfamily)
MLRTNDAPSDEFIHLLTSSQTQLRGLIHAAIANYADSQDVLQRTNLAIWKKASEFDPARSFLGWAVGVARYEILAFLRDKTRDRLLFTPELAELVVADAEELLAQVPHRQEALRECLKSLPESSRELLVRKYTGGMSVEQLSTVLGRSQDGVKSLLLRIRRVLAECIERRLARLHAGL